MYTQRNKTRTNRRLLNSSNTIEKTAEKPKYPKKKKNSTSKKNVFSKKTAGVRVCFQIYQS